MKKYRAVYKGFNNKEMLTKTYDSLAVCKRFTKSQNPIRYEEIEITYSYSDDMQPIRKNVRISVIN